MTQDFDTTGMFIAEDPQEPVVAIHTHDRINFKRCRLRWSFRSELRSHLVPKGEARAPLWFGSGIHFALEDYHGYHKFSTLQHGFQAYYNCFRQWYPQELPPDHEDLYELGMGMLNYYDLWLSQRNEYQTLWIDGVPQVEVDFSIELTDISREVGYPVYYQGTFDRVVTDSEGRIWVEDYKTVKQFDTGKLETDPQISSYSWAASQHYQHPVEGVLYLQMKKAVPHPPRMTRQGLSVDKQQLTTAKLYRLALNEAGYAPGVVLPDKYVAFLNYLMEQETIDGDRFIRWDKVRRNQTSQELEYQNILLETREMLNPELPIYPNPTRDCSWDCDYRSVHLGMMDDADYEWLLREAYEVKGEDRHVWRTKIVWEDPPLQLARGQELRIDPDSLLP